MAILWLTNNPPITTTRKPLTTCHEKRRAQPRSAESKPCSCLAGLERRTKAVVPMYSSCLAVILTYKFFCPNDPCNKKLHRIALITRVSAQLDRSAAVYGTQTRTRDDRTTKFVYSRRMLEQLTGHPLLLACCTVLRCASTSGHQVAKLTVRSDFADQLQVCTQEA
jgi:hypothetical protein